MSQQYPQLPRVGAQNGGFSNTLCLLHHILTFLICCSYIIYLTSVLQLTILHSNLLSSKQWHTALLHAGYPTELLVLLLFPPPTKSPNGTPSNSLITMTLTKSILDKDVSSHPSYWMNLLLFGYFEYRILFIVHQII